MKKVAVVYWSGTGNTEKMAKAVADGARAAGAEAELLEVSQASVEAVLKADGIALGCPAMGDEVLEESEMEPFVEALEKGLSGKNVVLFGSYDWGDGQWMRDWADRTKASGAVLAAEGLIVNNEPDDEGLAQCKELGAALA